MPHLLLPYIGLIALLTITPGPDMLLVLKNGVRGGDRLAWATGLGCCTGIGMHAVAATLGLSAILAASAEAFTVVKLVGAAYLVWLGVTSVLATLGSRSERGEGAGRGESLAELARARSTRAGPVIGRRTAYRHGLLTNLLNPKIAILFLTLMPQFVADGEPRLRTTAVLAATFVVVALMFMRVFSLTVGGITRLLERGWVATWIERVTGSLLAAIGLGVALEAR